MNDKGLGEEAVVFPCEGEELCGIIHPGGQEAASRGLLVIVGGPQYRVGSHRQFVFLARSLAAEGYPVMRFDYQGMGDSGGKFHDFSEIEPDIRAALDTFRERFPEIQEVVLWGLCDAASAAAFYAFQDERVSGLVLVNPWVRTEEGEARARLRHYYLERLGSRDFWRKVATFRWSPSASLGHLVQFASRLFPRSKGDNALNWRQKPLPERMLYGLQRFRGQTLVLLSGRDLTAQEFEDTVARSQAWQDWAAQKAVRWQRLSEADHTFSRRLWKEQVAVYTEEWMDSW